MDRRAHRADDTRAPDERVHRASRLFLAACTAGLVRSFVLYVGRFLGRFGRREPELSHGTLRQHTEAEGHADEDPRGDRRKVARLVGTRGTIDAGTLDGLEEILLGADIGSATVTEVIAAIRERVRREGLPGTSGLLPLLEEEIARLFEGHGAVAADPFALDGARPRVIMVVGINGVGKTTSIGKLAFRYVRDGKKVMIAVPPTRSAPRQTNRSVYGRNGRGRRSYSRSTGRIPPRSPLTRCMPPDRGAPT